MSAAGRKNPYSPSQTVIMGSPFNFLRTIKLKLRLENDVRFRLSRLSDPSPGLNTIFIVRAEDCPSGDIS